MTKVAGEDLSRRLATRAVHAGHIADPLAGAVMAPIYQTSTFVQEGLGKHKGYEYARTSNPTRAALERNLAALEGGRFAFAFASGMAAINAVMSLLKGGDHVVAGRSLYGGSFRLFERVLKDFGLSFSYADTCRLGDVGRALRPNTRLIFIETPTNPVMEITDISAVAALARE